MSLRSFVVPLVVIALLVLGSFIYWVGEGRPRSPAAFRELVADTGLVIDWTNNGSRGGDGTAQTDCGVVDVTVSELDGELWLFVEDQRAPITEASIDELLACESN